MKEETKARGWKEQGGVTEDTADSMLDVVPFSRNIQSMILILQLGNSVRYIKDQRTSSSIMRSIV